jgi:hypothetical protein
MPTVIAHHDVKDKDHWLASPKPKEAFAPLGVTNIRTFVDPQNPTRVAVLMDVRDMDALMRAMGTKAMADALAYEGVLPQTALMCVEAWFPLRDWARVTTAPAHTAAQVQSALLRLPWSTIELDRSRLPAGQIPQVCSCSCCSAGSSSTAVPCQPQVIASTRVL